MRLDLLNWFVCGNSRAMGRVWIAAVVLAFAACGGKEHGQGGDDAGVDGGGRGPAPSCGAICAHVVGTCASGADTGPCTMDCEMTRAQFTHCSYQLDAYLRCMVTTDVECNQGDVVIVGCSFERNELEACQH
jgi:hypothetical protein